MPEEWHIDRTDIRPTRLVVHPYIVIIELKAATTGIVFGKGIYLHLWQFLAPVGKKLMKEARLMKGYIIRLSHFAKRALEIVCHVRHIVIVGNSCLLRLSHSMSRIIRIRAAMIHIIAREIASATEFADSKRHSLITANIYTTVIWRHHTTPKFTGEVRIG